MMIPNYTLNIYVGIYLIIFNAKSATQKILCAFPCHKRCIF
ncbi:hypothetical protein APS_0924 [Acetobacter pasteurianus subsp. pasteurianus LMG 1262 = NBRC 106471]|nr:hypothetical protein APS_0924 [Acetobacter pasteurianus subsp. pasteurianus LMG 1262 = NBRC 106471]